MPNPSRQARMIRFGIYEADLAGRELRKDGAKVKLQDRPFEVLTILLERPGDVIAREEFRQRLWPADTFVDFDPSLNTSINKLRQALSDDAENPRFIATVGRRGYRFIAPTDAGKSQDLRAALAVGSAPATNGETESKNPAGRLSRRLAGAVIGAAILVAAFVAARRYLPEPPPKVLNVGQVSHNGRLDPWGRLTTDGARLFFLERAGGHWNLMQVPAAGGDAQMFPDPSRNVRIVDISPDRSEFLSFEFSTRSTDLPLSLTPVVGGPPRRVGDIIADDATFAPSGKRIFFNKPDGIYSCERDGSDSRKLVALPGRSENPRWSGDGKRLRFTLLDPNASVANRSSVWEVSADGRGLHPILANWPLAGHECCGAWSADGRYFLFESVHDGIRSVWAVRDNDSWFAATPKPVQLTFGPISYGNATPDGDPRKVFVWGGKEQRELVSYESISQRFGPIIPGVQTTDLAFSPDGVWAAYAADGTVRRIRSDRSQQQPLISGFASIDQLQWSPNGGRILFRAAQDNETRERFFSVAADGGTPTELVMGGGHNEATWSADGESITFARWPEERRERDADSGIYALDLKTSHIARIPGSEDLIHPRWSPSGQFLAAISQLQSGQPTRLKLLDSRKQIWKQIAEGTLLNDPVWSRDSKYLYYQDILGPEEPVYRFAIGSQKAEKVFDFSALLRAGYIRCALVGFTPDGAPMALLSRGEADVYKLELELP